MLAKPEFKVRELIKRSNVKAINTTDDPADSLEWHKKLAAEETAFKVYPAWRPDKALNIDAPMLTTSRLLVLQKILKSRLLLT